MWVPGPWNQQPKLHHAYSQVLQLCARPRGSCLKEEGEIKIECVLGCHTHALEALLGWRGDGKKRGASSQLVEEGGTKIWGQPSRRSPFLCISGSHSQCFHVLGPACREMQNQTLSVVTFNVLGSDFCLWPQVRASQHLQSWGVTCGQASFGSLFSQLCWAWSLIGPA